MKAIELTKESWAKIQLLPPRDKTQVLSALGRREFERCSSDPMYWLDAARHANVPYVFTIDPKQLYTCNMCMSSGATTTADLAYGKYSFATHLEQTHGFTKEEAKSNRAEDAFTPLPAIRPFPIKEYIEPLVRAWQQHQLLAVEKSRDMMATWLMVALYTWDTMFHVGRQNLFISRESVKTRDIIKRAHFIMQHSPKWLFDGSKALYSQGQNKAGIIEIPETKSEILGFPQGADQIRTYHPSGVFLDEAAFQEQAGDAFGAIKPSIKDGGRCTMISSANPSFFQKICEDRTDEEEF